MMTDRALKVGDTTIPLVCDPGVPTVYFELVASSNYIPGLIEIVLATGVLLPNSEGIVERVAHVSGVLKCNIIAAQNLRDSLVHALSILEKPTDPMMSN